MGCKARGTCFERWRHSRHSYCSKEPRPGSGGASPARKSDGASSQPSLLSFEVYPPRTPPGGTGQAIKRQNYTLLCSSRSRSNSKGGNGRHFYCSRATARELLTASIKSHANSSHRSAYGGYSSNSKKFSLPLER